MPRRIKREQIVEFQRLRFGEKLNRQTACDIAGVSASWASKHEKQFHAGEVPDYVKHWKPVKLPHGGDERNTDVVVAMANDIPPLKPEEWGPEAVHQIEDFHYFCQVQFGVIATPWRRAAFERVWRLWESEEKEYVVLNAPPGVGKSQLTSHDIPAYVTVLDRRIRGLMGSSTDRLAIPYTRKLRDSFMRRQPLIAHDNDKRLGIAVDGSRTLINDFGRFRGDDQFQLWQANQWAVEQIDGLSTGEKEATWQAYGRGAEVLGNRQAWITWDDLVTRRSMSETSSPEFLMWFEDEAETRLEPGGLFVLNGQRLGNDLYRNRLDCEVIDIDDDGNEIVYRKYHHIVFRAHEEEICDGDHSRQAQFQKFDEDGNLDQMGGCLLDPKRLTYRELRQIERSNPQKYAVVYQQGDYAAGDHLVEQRWIDGGEDPVTGELFPGCMDEDRGRLQIPANLEPATVSVGTVDPSSAKRWSVQWWLNEPTLDTDHLMDLYLGQLTAGELLSYNPSTREYYGMMHEWQLRSIEMGRSIQAWVVETNAAQRYLLQHQFVYQWMQRFSVTIISHKTHAHNKHDPQHGFWAMRNQYRWGKVRLPFARDAGGFHTSMKLVEQALRWTSEQRGGRSGDDALMAQWIYRVNLDRITVPESRPVSVPASLLAPSWLR